MKKSKLTIVATILLVLTVSVAILSGCIGRANPANANLDFDGLASAPTQEAMTKATAVDKNQIKLSATKTDDQGVLDSIEYLLRLSNQNLIDCDFFAAASYGNGEASINGGTIVGSMETREVRIFDHEEYYFDSYGLIVEGYSVKKDGSKGKVPDSILSVLASALNYTKRVYTPNNKDFYFSDNGETSVDTIVKFPDQNAVSYPKPKAKKMTCEEYMDMVNSRGSYKGFTTDNYDTEKPITSGLLTYDQSTGIYHIECDINCKDETLEKSIADMLAIGAIKEFEYAEKHLTIEIWDCGLIRTYINSNVWKAKMILGLEGSSDNFYEQWFTYDSSKLDKMNISQDLKNNLMM